MEEKRDGSETRMQGGTNGSKIRLMNKNGEAGDGMGKVKRKREKILLETQRPLQQDTSTDVADI